MSSKSRTEGVTGVTKGVMGTRDPQRQSSLKGVTGGHHTIQVTPVTPQSGGHDALTGENFQESFGEGQKFELEEFSRTVVA